MLDVTLSGDDLAKGGLVKIGRVPLAIAEANGSENIKQAERKIFAQINAGVQCGQLRPLSPETLEPLSRHDYGTGIVPFAELVAWGHSTKLYDFKSDWEARELEAGFAEQIYNGKLIDWRYWVDRMPQLSAGEAARLMSALDPVIYSNLDTRPNKNDPTTRCRKTESIQRLAERQGMNAASPVAWLAWADAEGIKVHDGFRHAVESSAPSDLTEYTEREAGATTTRRMTQAEHIKLLSDIQERKSRGYYTMSEVAQTLADTYPALNAASLLQRMEADYYEGKLVVRERSTEAKHLPGSKLRPHYDWMFPEDIQAMLKHWGWTREFPFQQSTEHTEVLPIAAKTAATIAVDDWQLIKPKRFPGYRKPLFDYLKAEKEAGHSLPKARDVLDEWKKRKPVEVFEVTNEGLKYYDGNGGVKAADLDAIRKAIDRQVKKRPTTGRPG